MANVRTHVIPLDFTSLPALRRPNTFNARAGTAVIGATLDRRTGSLVLALAEPETALTGTIDITVFTVVDGDPWPPDAFFLITAFGPPVAAPNNHVAIVHFGAIMSAR